MDLKPSNILLTVDGPRVIDFGIVRAVDASLDSTITRTAHPTGGRDTAAFFSVLVSQTVGP
ncbi:hypothetical protein [Streptomyces sp. MNU89]|uniref:hypothetical protein n=1 Tax=Streptomyces sp. MNU89 TaxID=2560025 RepID=UPI0035A82D91